MKPSFKSTNITSKRGDSHLNDAQFWGRMEQMANELHAKCPDLEFVRTIDTWEIRGANRAAMDAFTDWAEMFCKRIKDTYRATGDPKFQWVMQVHTPGDAVQALILTIFSNHKTGNRAAVQSLNKLKPDFSGALNGRISQI